METQRLYIRKARRPLEILILAARYLGRARALFAAIGVFVLPVALTAATVAYFAKGGRRDFEDVILYKSALEKNAYLVFLAAYLVYAIGLGIHSLLVSKHLLLSDEPDRTGSLSLSDLKNGLKPQLLRFAGEFTVFYVAWAVVSHLYHAFYMRFGAPMPYDWDLDYLIEYVWDYGIFFVVTLGAVPLALYLFATAPFVCIREGISITEAAMKVWGYLKKNLAKTWGYSLLFLLLVLVAYRGVSLGLSLLEFFVVMSTDRPAFPFLLLLFFRLLETVAVLLLLTFFQWCSILLLGSLEDEAEGHYLKSKVEEV